MAVRKFPVNSFPIVAFNDAELLPNSGADVQTVDCILQHISFANITAGAVTVTVSDKQGTPRDLLKTVSIPANSTVVYNFQGGKLMKGGFSWVASAATSIVGSYCALVK